MSVEKREKREEERKSVLTMVSTNASTNLHILPKVHILIIKSVCRPLSVYYVRIWWDGLVVFCIWSINNKTMIIHRFMLFSRSKDLALVVTKKWLPGTNQEDSYANFHGIIISCPSQFKGIVSPRKIF